MAEDEVFELGVVEVNGDSGRETRSDKETLTAEDISRNERLIYLRGFNSRQVPLFMVGIPVYVPYDGNVDLNRFAELQYGPLPADILYSLRVGPSEFSLGLLEAVDDNTLPTGRSGKRQGLNGHANIVWVEDRQHNATGRFGLKANALPSSNRSPAP
ncbi:MAG: hypothetical protein ACXV7J_04390 [Methylomonas sp.]